MNIEISDKAKKRLKKFPSNLRKSAYKSFALLADNPNHPSLNRKKMSGTDLYEARITYHYRMSFFIENDTIFIISVGPHDEGLGKK